jgi:hypothetical protein
VASFLLAFPPASYVGGLADFLCPFIWSRVSDLMRFRTADQKQRNINVCELHQIASDAAAFLSRVITGGESWIYGYGPYTKQQSSQRKKKSRVKNMLVIVFDIKGIVHKEFVLAGQTVNSA